MVTLPSDTMPVGSRQARKITARNGSSTGWMARMAPPATSTPLPPFEAEIQGLKVAHHRQDGGQIHAQPGRDAGVGRQEVEQPAADAHGQHAL